ncbi:MAG TPA: TRAP transporter substrate-binding protein [Candidatus Methylomirabilis sp.]|nr:TRAP transporter substrate-binding protein [Candidatus Methylomirabilis sp.]
MKRPASLIFLTMALLVGLVLATTSPALAAKKVIKLSHSHQADFASEIHTAAWIFQKWIEDNSDTLEVKIYAANALGEERAVYEGMQLGSGATAVISGTAILNNFNKKIAVLDLPFLWKSYDHAHRVLDGKVGEALAKDLDQTGFQVLAWMDSWGFRNVVTAKKEVKTPADLKGLKIRTIQTPTYVAALNAMGANATPMAFGEVYTAMQTGVLDGYEHGSAVTKAQKFYEVSKYIALTQHLFGPLVFAYSKKDWAQLSDKEKAVILEGARMARDVQRTLGPLREQEAFDFLKSKGMVIHKIDTSSFQKNAVAIQDSFAKERGATDLLQMIRSTD